MDLFLSQHLPGHITQHGKQPSPTRIQGRVEPSIYGRAEPPEAPVSLLRQLRHDTSAEPRRPLLRKNLADHPPDEAACRVPGKFPGLVIDIEEAPAGVQHERGI